MAFNLDGVGHDRSWVGYYAYAPGIDTDGNECTMVVSHNSHASGCNPYYWTVSHNNRYGHEFSSQEQAEQEAKYAAGSWTVKRVYLDKIKIGVVKFTSKKTATNMGNLSND